LAFAESGSTAQCLAEFHPIAVAVASWAFALEFAKNPATGIANPTPAARFSNARRSAAMIDPSSSIPASCRRFTNPLPFLARLRH
jgi:hypothetical protein